MKHMNLLSKKGEEMGPNQIKTRDNSRDDKDPQNKEKK